MTHYLDSHFILDLIFSGNVFNLRFRVSWVLVTIKMKLSNSSLCLTKLRKFYLQGSCFD
jgi:hypothetical protein